MASGASSLFAPNYTRILSASKFADNAGLNTELSVGAIQAIADDQIKENPVHIPTVMISAHAGMQLLWVEKGEVGSFSDLLRAKFTYSPARGSSWDDLFKIAGPNAKVSADVVHGQGSTVRGESWPEDKYQRFKLLSRLLRDHHSESKFGSPERWAYLKKAVARLGYAEDMETILADGRWRPEAADFDNAEFDMDDVTVTPLTKDAPSTTFLTHHLSTLSFSRSSPESLMACRVESGLYYNVKLHETDYASLSLLSPGRRIADLLQTQACLEKLIMTNGATIGRYLQLLRRDTAQDEWERLVRQLMHPFRAPHEKHNSIISAYIELGSLYEDRMPRDELMTLAEWIDGGMQRKEPRKAEPTPTPRPDYFPDEDIPEWADAHETDNSTAEATSEAAAAEAESKEDATPLP